MNSNTIKKAIFFLSALLLAQIFILILPGQIFASDCSNECLYIGQRQCSDSSAFIMCGYFGSDLCLGWSNLVYCEDGYTCSNGSCVKGDSNAPVANAGGDESVYENGSVYLSASASSPEGYSMTYSWSCTGGILSSYNTLNPTFYAPAVSSNTYYSCTLTVRDSAGLTDSDQVSIYVQNYSQSSTFYVSLSATPNSGCYPLNDVDMTATLYGTVPSGYTTYYFDCTNDGVWDKIYSNYTSSYTAYDICDYSSSGTYYAKVRAERQGYSAENTVAINPTFCQTSSSLTVSESVRNLSNGTAFSDYVSANPGDVLSFSVKIQAGSSALSDVTVKDALSGKFILRTSTVKIDGAYYGGDLTSGINAGYFSAYQIKTLTFDADVAGASDFSYGSSQIINSVFVYNSSISNSDTATINVIRTSVLGEATGTATGVSTGFTNNIWLDTVILPFAIALILLFIFRTKILKIEEWFDKRKGDYQKYKSDKVLKTKITKARIGEILGKKIL
jgi:hypothetical protein